MENNWIKGKQLNKNNKFADANSIIIETEDGTKYEVVSRASYKSVDDDMIIVHKSEVVGEWEEKIDAK